MELQTHTTPHIQFTEVTKPNTPVVTLRISIDLHDQASTLSHGALGLYCGMLLSGAGAYSRNEFIGAITSLGAVIAVEYDDHMIHLHLDTPAKQLSAALELFSLMLTHPTWNPKELTRSKKNALDGLVLSAEDSRLQAQEGLLRALYQPNDRGYAPTASHLTESITNTTKTELVAIHKDIMSRPWIATIAGTNTLTTRVCKVLTNLHQSPIQPRAFITPAAVAPKNPTSIELITKSIPSRQNIDLSMGARISLTPRDPEYAALAFGLAVLGKWGGFAGRLMSTVREKEGLTYGIYARIESATTQTPGNWRIMTFFSPKDVVQGLTSTFRELAAICTKGITADEYTRFKNIIATGEILSHDSLIEYAAKVHNHIVSGVSIEEYAAFVTRLQKVTRAEINKALATHLNPTAFIISAAGPTRAVEAELRKLVS